MANKRKGANLAVAAGLTAALSVGQVPAVAFAEASEDGSQQSGESQVAEGFEGSSSAVVSMEGGSAGGVDPSSAEGSDAAADSGVGLEGAGSTQASIVSLTEPQPVVVSGGSAVLPETVVAAFDDGTSSAVPVSWSLDGVGVDTGAVAQLEPGAYSFLGTVEGTGLTVSYEVEVASPVADAQAPGASDTAVQSTSQQSAQAKTAGSQSVEIDGVTWSYSASYVLPTGFDPELAFTYEIPWEDMNVTFTSETGETYEYNLAYWASRDFSGVDYSTAGEYDAIFTVDEHDAVLAGLSFPVHFTFMDATEPPTEFNVTTQVQSVGPEYSPYIPIPYYQTLTLSDGTACEAYIDWNQEELEALEQSANTPGTYTIHGVYHSNPGVETTATVWVQAIRSVDPATVYTAPGASPVMPKTVYVEYENGETGWVDVEWDQIDPSQYAEKGSFRITGKVANTDIIAVAEILVSDLIEVTHGSLVVAAGKAPNYVYTSIAMRYEYGTSHPNPSWKLPDSDDPRWSTPGTFELHGTVEGYDYDFICDVTVIDVDSYESEIDIKTCPGYLSMPSTVDATTPDGERFSLYVEWDYWGAFREPGSYTVNGVIEGTDLPVVANVEVMEIVDIPGIAESYSTIEGVLPNLPQNTVVTLEDGTTINMTVSWEAPLPEAFTSEASSIMVRGKLYNGDPVSTEVRVLWTQPVRDEVRASTLVGMAPQLPETVQATMSDGSTRSVQIQWETPDPQDYVQAGSSFQVNGYIQGSDYAVSANVAVCDVTDEPLWSISMAEGDTPRYPLYTTSVKLDNGDTYTVPYERLDWNEPDPSTLKAGSTVEVTGGVVGSPAVLKGSVTVVKAVELTTSELDITYLPNKYSSSVESRIPQSVTALTDTGEAVEVGIAWDPIDPAIADKPGVYEVKGTAAGYPITCSIHVLKAKSAVAQEPLVVLAGNTSYSQLVYLDVRCDDGSGEDVVVQYGVSEFDWSDAEEALATPGIHEVQVPTYFFGKDPVSVSLTVEVYDEVVSVEGVSGWVTPQGQYSLPYELDVTLSMPDTSPIASIASAFSGEPAITTKTVTMGVSWNYDLSSVIAGAAVGETVSVSGTIYELGYPVTCDVEVVEIESISAPQVSIAPGVDPVLPNLVPIGLSNGETAMMPVSWNYDFDREALGTPGASFEVEGTVYGNYGGSLNLAVSCLVTVEGVAAVAEESTAALTSLVSEVGTRPVLPGIVPVELTNGAYASAAVDWNWDSVDESLFYQVGAEFDVPGTVRGISTATRMARSAGPGEVTAHVKIVESGIASDVSYVYPAVTTLVASNAEVEDSIAAMASVIMSDGGYVQYDVEWDYSTLDLSKPGTYVVKGTLPDVGKAAYAYVTVVGDDDVRTPVSAQKAQVVLEIPEGGLTPQQLSQSLPTNVIVEYSTGEPSAAPVGWNLEGITPQQLSQPGTFEIKGIIDGLPNLEAVAEVQLVNDLSEAAVPVEPASPIEVDTYMTFAPELPQTVAFKLSNGEVKDLEVVWEQPSASDYNVTGEFTVRGVVSGYGTEVEATVSVLPYVAVTAIQVSCEQADENGIVHLEKGQTAKIEAAVEPADATFNEIAFSSSDPGIVDVSADGTVTAGDKDGVASVLVEAYGHTAVVQVVVGTGVEPEPEPDPDPAIPVSSVTISGEGVENGSVTISKGVALQLSAAVNPTNADDKTIAWTTSNASVATVDGNGVVTAVAGGTATITATATSGASASLTIVVPRSLESTVLELVNPDACRVELGDAFDVSALEFQLASVYDDGSRESAPIAADAIEIAGSVDVQKAGSYTLTATVKGSPELACEFDVIVWDPNVVGEPIEKPAVDPNAGAGDAGATDENAPGKGEEDSKALAGTGDSAAPVVAGVTATGIVAMIGAWIARRRGRSER